MKLFVDTNVFIAAVADEPGRGATAADFLNRDHEFCTTILNLMEIRTVLAKKKRVEQGRVEQVLADIVESVDVYVPDFGDMVDAYRVQRETLLYPLDCLILVTADAEDAPLVTFDSELLDNGAEPPEEFIG